MKKNILVALILIILVMVSVGLYFYKDRIITLISRDDQSSQEKLDSYSKQINSQIQAAQKCEILYQDFLTEYGTDYNTCFKDFNFETSNCDTTRVDGEEKKNLNILVILDSSGSMAGTVDGQKKIDIAKESISKFLTSLTEDTKVGLMVYGHKGGNTEAEKTLSCNSIDLVYPLSTDKSGLENSLSSFNATGWTPIADSLKMAESVFAGLDADKNDNYIYIVSNGIETCGGDPIAAAKQINNSGIKAIVNVIGFDVDSDSAKKLESIATAGSGSFYQARNSNDLNRVFEETRSIVNEMACRTNQIISSTAVSNNILIDMNACVRNIISQKELPAQLKIFSDTNRKWLLDTSYNNDQKIITGGYCDGLNKTNCQECLDYLTENLSERHDKILEIKDGIETQNKEKFDQSIDAIGGNLDETR